jgi:hypothetical protein
MGAHRSDVELLVDRVDSVLRRHSFSRDRGGRNNEVVSQSWRKIEGANVSALRLSTWDPWDDVRLHASRGDVAALEAYWAGLDPMTVARMTPADMVFAIERGAKGEVRTFILEGKPSTWATQTDAAVNWLLDSQMRQPE